MAVFQQENVTVYFDTAGRVVRFVLRAYDSTIQTTLYQYNAAGDCVATEYNNPNSGNQVRVTSLKYYEGGRLVKDSSTSGYFCKHMAYYPDGNLRQEYWYGKDHRLQRAFWFGLDSLGRMNRVIDRDYAGNSDPAGRLLSNRKLFYNENGYLAREEEAVPNNATGAKSLFCNNAGSGTFVYDASGRLVAINRTNGPSQKIAYLENGLIANVATSGSNCEGVAYQWDHRYIYTYRQ